MPPLSVLISRLSSDVHDITEVHKLLREDDEAVYGDSGNFGLEKRDEIVNDENLSKIYFRIVRRSSVRCKVEHAFHYIKVGFKFTIVRYHVV